MNSHRRRHVAAAAAVRRPPRHVLPCPAAAHVHAKRRVAARGQPVRHPAHVGALVAARQAVNQQHDRRRRPVVGGAIFVQRDLVAARPRAARRRRARSGASPCTAAACTANRPPPRSAGGRSAASGGDETSNVPRWTGMAGHDSGAGGGWVSRSRFSRYQIYVRLVTADRAAACVNAKLDANPAITRRVPLAEASGKRVLASALAAASGTLPSQL